MRIFASERVASMMRRLGMKPGEPIEHNLVTKAIENAQRKLEGHHFDVRKQLLDYDNVANDQRKVIYSQRGAIMEMVDPLEAVESMREEVMSALVNNYIPPESLEDQWDIPLLMQVLADDFKLKVPVKQWIDSDHSIQPEQIKEKILAISTTQYKEKEQHIGREILAQFEKSVILQTMDNHWREHLAAMDHLRQGIHLRGYAQKDPKQEYKREAFALFSSMLDSLKYDIIRMLASVEIKTEEDVSAIEDQRRAEQAQKMQFIHADDTQSIDIDDENTVTTFKRNEQKVGRNDACPCGSGKKYKNCHGSLA